MSERFAVYVHIPFCTIKCGYCDFNAYAGMDSLKDAYGAALVAEVRANAPFFEGKTVTSIGFGGGTPGEMPPEHIAAVIQAIHDQAPLLNGAEVTLEANPGTLSAAALAALHRAGLNRLSIGAQSFHSHELGFLDRIHSPEATAACVDLARRAGFRNIGLDLIYGLPGQSMEEWLASLDAAIALAPDHLSCYALTVEDGTLLARRVREGKVIPADSDAVADMYEAASERLEAAGFVQYELSNWAGRGGKSEHNFTYWSDGEYMAIGAGAHGYLGFERYENISHPKAYIQAIRANPGPRPALAAIHELSFRVEVSDWIALHLRTAQGLLIQAFEERFGFTLQSVLHLELDELAAAGVLEIDDVARLTPRGRLLHSEVAARVRAALDAHDLPLPRHGSIEHERRLKRDLPSGSRPAPSPER